MQRVCEETQGSLQGVRVALVLFIHIYILLLFRSINTSVVLMTNLKILDLSSRQTGGKLVHKQKETSDFCLS